MSAAHTDSSHPSLLSSAISLGVSLNSFLFVPSFFRAFSLASLISSRYLRSLTFYSFVVFAPLPHPNPPPSTRFRWHCARSHDSTSLANVGHRESWDEQSMREVGGTGEKKRGRSPSIFLLIPPRPCARELKGTLPPREGSYAVCRAYEGSRSPLPWLGALFIGERAPAHTRSPLAGKPDREEKIYRLVERIQLWSKAFKTRALVFFFCFFF